MYMISFVPEYLRLAPARDEFLNWLIALPISTHERRHVYFDWLDFNQLPYTASEINSLRTSQDRTDAGYPQ